MVDSIRMKLANEYKSLSTQFNLTEKQRDGYRSKYQTTQKELDELKSTIRRLNEQVAKTKEEGVKLQKLSTSALSSDVEEYLSGSKEFAEAERLLKDLGYARYRRDVKSCIPIHA